MTRIARTLAPTAAPLRTRDFALAVAGACSAAASETRFARELSARFGAPYCRLVSSGRAALSVALQALGKLAPNRRNVIIPAYTSYSVPAAVVNAGLEVVLCDIDPLTLDFAGDDLEALVDDRTLAVVPDHLFGFPSEMDGITALARHRGAFVVEDAAQALGATLRGRRIGTLGDVAILSLGRGKNITALDGGVIMTNRDEIAHQMDEVAGTQAPIRWLDPFKAAALSLLLAPRLYWLPDSLPWLDLGVSKFEPDFAVEPLTGFRIGLARGGFEQLDVLTAIRRANAERYLSRLSDTGRFDLVRAIAGSEPAYLRLPILCEDPAVRDAVARMLRARGKGVSMAYPLCLADLPALQRHLVHGTHRFDGARRVAERILTLPTHPFVTPSDIEAICAALRDVSRARSGMVAVR